MPHHTTRAQRFVKEEHERSLRRKTEEADSLREVVECSGQEMEKVKAEAKAALRTAQQEADRTSRRVMAVSSEHEKALAQLVAERDAQAVEHERAMGAALSALREEHHYASLRTVDHRRPTD